MEDAASHWRDLADLLDQFVSGRIGTIEVSRRVSSLQTKLNEHSNELFYPFVAFDSETDHLPIGDLRDRYSASGLAKADAERAAIDEAAVGELRELAKPLLKYAKEHAI
jgi:hypothetical protein